VIQNHGIKATVTYAQATIYMLYYNSNLMRFRLSPNYYTASTYTLLTKIEENNLPFCTFAKWHQMEWTPVLETGKKFC